jgi:hypothetical protein
MGPGGLEEIMKTTPSKKTEAALLEKLRVIATIIASATRDLQSYTFEGDTIEGAWGVMCGRGPDRLFLTERMEDLFDLIHAQFADYDERCEGDW